MLHNAMLICDATGGSIGRWDGDALHHVAVMQAQPAFADIMRRTPIHPNPESNIGRMLATKTVVHISDLSAQPAYIERTDPGIITTVEIGKIRTVLAVPMLRESELYGAIILAREEVRPFSDKQIALVRRTLPLKQSSPSRMRGCSMSFANPFSNRPQPPTCSRSSAAQPLTCK